MPYIILRFRQSGLVGLQTLVLSGGSSLALLNYLFRGSARDFVVLMAMCLLFGVLMYFVFFGSQWTVMREYLGPSRHRTPPPASPY